MRLVSSLFLLSFLINSFASERFDYLARSTTDQHLEGIRGLSLPWLRFLGLSLVLLESAINGLRLEWRPISFEDGVDIEMCQLMKMLRFFDLRMKNLERGV